MSQSNRLLSLEYHQGLMNVEYRELLSRLERLEKIIHMNTIRKQEKMRNKEMSGTTEDNKYS